MARIASDITRENAAETERGSGLALGCIKPPEVVLLPLALNTLDEFIFFYWGDSKLSLTSLSLFFCMAVGERSFW
jgi:hypothetical protein